MQANNNYKTHSFDPVSSLLLGIYRAAHELPLDQFQDAVLKQLKPYLKFDSGFWGTVVYEGDSAVVHSHHLMEQPKDIIEDWQQVSHEDVIAQAVAANPSRTFNAHAPTLLRDRGRSAIRNHIERYKLANCLASSAPAESMPVLDWLSLFRGDPDRQFTEGERTFYQALFPHMVEALTINRLIHLDAMYTSRQSGRAAVAIVDRKGFIYNSDGGFEQTLRAEWPAWSARTLPQQLVQEIVSHPVAHYRGQAIHVASQRVGDLFFLKVRELGAVDRLTKREKQIAERFAQGLSHKEIAKLLALAPATVRNYIQTIYGKLGVRDKAALANLMVKSE